MKLFLYIHYLFIFVGNINITYMLRVKEIAKEKGITMQVLAKRMGITQPGLSMLLNRNLTLQKLCEIAKALEVPVPELFKEEESSSVRITCPHCGKSVTLKVE